MQEDSFSTDMPDPGLLNEASEFEVSPDFFDNDHLDFSFTDSNVSLDETSWDDSIGLDFCSSTTDPLGRRGEACTNMKNIRVENKAPDIEVRPLGRTQDRPLLPPELNRKICYSALAGDRGKPVCDSGEPSDRILSPLQMVFALYDCTPCITDEVLDLFPD